jgi:hypothetical protein
MNSQTNFPTVKDLSNQLYEIIADAIDKTFRELLKGVNSESENNFFLYNSGLPHPIANLLIAKDFSDTKKLIQPIEKLCANNLPSAVLCLGSVNDEFTRMLLSQGYQFAEKVSAMAINLQDLKLKKLDNEYSIKQVGPNEHKLWAETVSVGYEVPEKLADLFGPAKTESIANKAREYKHYIVFHHDRPVSTAMNITRDGIIEVYWISTIAEYRGRGIGQFATGEPLRLAHNQGYQTAILQSSAIGESVYRQLGFESFGDIPLYVRIPTS